MSRIIIKTDRGTDVFFPFRIKLLKVIKEFMDKNTYGNNYDPLKIIIDSDGNITIEDYNEEEIKSDTSEVKNND